MFLASLLMFGQNTRLDGGTFVGRTYINQFLGLEFTRPATLHYEGSHAPLHRQGEATILISALGKDEPGQVTPLMVLSAERLAHDSAEQTASKYLSELEANERKNGFRLLRPERELSVGRAKLLRVDLIKDPLCETILITVHRGFALVLFAVSGNKEDLDRMIDSTQISLNE